MIGAEILLRAVTSRIGLLVIAFAAVFVFYEGLPVPRFVRSIPFIGDVVADLTDGRVDRVARAAREGYVLQVERDAATARADELERQLTAGRKALELYAELLADAQRREAVTLEESEKRIADYEKELSAAGRSDPLTDDDVKFLQRK